MTEQERIQENATRRRERQAFREGMEHRATLPENWLCPVDCGSCENEIRNRYPYLEERKLREYRGYRWNPEKRQAEVYQAFDGSWTMVMSQLFVEDVRDFLIDAQQNPYEEIAE